MNPDPRNSGLNSERWGQWSQDGHSEQNDDEDTQPHRAITPSSLAAHPATPDSQPGQRPQQAADDNAQFTHREHVTGALTVYPSEAPLFQPGQAYPPQQRPAYVAGYPPPYQPYPGGYAGQQPPPYQPYPGQQPLPMPYPAYQGYPGYAPYPYYAWQPPKPKQDGYRLGVVITALVGSILTFFGGLASLGITILLIIQSSGGTSSLNLQNSQNFGGLMTFIGLGIAGIVGGVYCIYHCIRGLLKKRSANFALPWFWIFIIPYLIVLGVGYALQANGQEVANLPLTIFLIILAAIFPVLALLALAARRLRVSQWTTSWRRFTLALTSGATLGIGLALVLELAFLLLLYRGPGATNFQKCIDNPMLPGCGSYSTFDLIFLVIAVAGPIIEETVKPLAVAFFIGRMRSASEAFMLGMGCGMGFAMIETIGYIGSGYHDWLTVAIERTGAGLLHGFGAAMVALGWYYLIHAKEKRFLKALGCWAYAVFQHFVWNGTAVLSLLPGEAGSRINSWNLTLGSVTLPFVEVLNIIEAVFILVFFIYMLRRLRRDTPAKPLAGEPKGDLSRQPALAG